MYDYGCLSFFFGRPAQMSDLLFLVAVTVLLHCFVDIYFYFVAQLAK